MSHAVQAKEKAAPAPWHPSCLPGRERGRLPRILPHGDRSRFFQSRKSDSGIVLPYRLFQIIPENPRLRFR